MKKSRLVRFAVSGMILLLILVAATVAQAQGKVKIGGFEFDAKGAEPAIPQELQPQLEGKYKKWIVQFTGPVHELEKKTLADLGASIGDYLPEFSFLVTMDNQTKNQVEKLPFVYGVVRHKPAYKISLGLKDQAGAVSLDKEKVRLWIRMDEAKDVGLVLSQVKKGTGKTLKVSGGVLEVEVSPSEIAGLAQIEETVWIEEAVDLEIQNDTTAWVIQTNQNNDTQIWNKGLHGEGQIVGIGDTGLDYDMPWFRDPAGNPIGSSHRKILAYDAGYGDDYDADEPGHGTHVAGTLAGDRTPVDGSGEANGMAPKAKLFIQDLARGSTNYLYPPLDLGQMFATPYQTGARIHSNSWGGLGGPYNSLAATADRFLWENKDFLALFANGNMGPASGTVLTPATAKNVISVGATLNGNSAENVTYFSSNGPTSDGRIKPTVCAPGDGEIDMAGILSADSDGIKNSYNSGTIRLRGTSMATPAVAGAAALVRQYFLDGYYPGGVPNPVDAIVPSAALVKAVLVNSAQEMDGAFTDGPIPSSGQGWGRVNLSTALSFGGGARNLEAVDESTGLATDQSWSREIFTVSGQPLKITLVWTDYPGAEGANKVLVNDLDLRVIAPDGTIYFGNDFSNGQSATGGSVDRVNVEEQVLIADPVGGTYEIEVIGYNIPNGPQPFALVVTGAFGVTSKGTLFLDRHRYNGSVPVTIRVFDRDLNGNAGVIEDVLVVVQSDTEPVTGESVLLQETGPDSGAFIGTLELRVGDAMTGNGILEVAGGDTITATYADADDGTGNPSAVSASALIDLVPPIISAVTVDSVYESSARIIWQTDEAADSEVNYGETSALDSSASDSRLMNQHVVSLDFLEEGRTYFFEILSADEAGNLASDDNNGSFHNFTTVNIPPRLTVKSSNGLRTSAPTTIIFGSAEDPSGVSSVTVNGTPAALVESDSNYSMQGYPGLGTTGFELEVALAAGTNTFEVLATDNTSSGNIQQETISVYRVLIHTVTASATAGGGIMFEGEKQYEQGTSPYYYVVPDAGFYIQDVLVDGVSQGPVNKYTFINITESHFIHAVFADKPLHTISVVPPVNGAISPGTATVVDGGSLKYTFTPNAGYKVGSVLIDGVNKGALSSWTFGQVAKDYSLEVTFIPDLLGITTAVSGAGVIDPPGTTAVQRGGSQTFNFLPNAGYMVQSVLVNGIARGALSSYTFENVQANQTLKVIFAPVMHTVTASAGEGGFTWPTGTKSYSQGTSPIYYIIAGSGYKVADVKVDGSSVGAVTKYTFTAISAPHTIEATYIAK